MHATAIDAKSASSGAGRVKPQGKHRVRTSRPSDVPALLSARRAQPRGKYRIRIFDLLTRTWQVIVIDDHIPLLRATAQPLFAHGRDMWVGLLEKAFAKYCGGYEKLNAGHLAWALNALTGEQVFRLKRSGGGKPRGASEAAACAFA